MPAVITPDSLTSIFQVAGLNDYSNHHPILFTLYLGLFINLGYFIADSLELGLFLYAFMQIIFMSAVFSLTLLTVFQTTNNRNTTLLLFMFLLFLPINLSFSHTIWKDVVFTCGVLLFSVSIYRYLKCIGSSSVNIALIILGGFLFLFF